MQRRSRKHGDLRGGETRGNAPFTEEPLFERAWRKGDKPHERGGRDEDGMSKITF